MLIQFCYLSTDVGYLSTDIFKNVSLVVHKLYDSLTKAGLEAMAASRTPAARNTSWRSTWHLQEDEWDPQWRSQLSQPKLFDLRCLITVETYDDSCLIWRHNPFPSCLGHLELLAIHLWIVSTCFISNYHVLSWPYDPHFLVCGDNSVFSSLLNFPSFFRIRSRVVLGM